MQIYVNSVLGFIYFTAVSFISWTLKAFGNFTDCRNKLSSHVALHNCIHWFLSRLCPYVHQPSPKTFGKVEAVIELKHRNSWTEVAERFLQSFHTLCFLPSQHHLHLPHSRVDRELEITPFHLFYLTYTKSTGAKVLWTSHSRLLSWHQRHTSPSPSKFLAIIFFCPLFVLCFVQVFVLCFVQVFVLCPLAVKVHLKVESCYETIRKKNKVQMLQR